ncbi:MAG: peptidoglycan-binding domain-containing protein [Burkholderiales bacterium]
MNRSGSSMSGSDHGTASSTDSQTVRQVQQALADKGHNPGPIDGVMGPQTRAALQKYQRQNNLSGASGLDKQTLDSLGVQASSSMGGSGSMAGRTDSGSSAGGTGSAAGGSGGHAGTGSKFPSSSSSADQGTASDGGGGSRDSGASAGGTGSTNGGAGGTARTPNSSPSGSNASQGTASDGGPTSDNPSGGTKR